MARRKFNPLVRDYLDLTGSGTGSGTIPQYTSDPVSPTAGQAWILRSGSVSAGGDIMTFIGGFPLVNPGGGGGYTYQFSYYTNEGTIIRNTLT